jgi:hypothetical protein
MQKQTKEGIMRKLFRQSFSCILVIFACICALAFAGCEGSDAKKAVTDTVNKLMGGDVIKKEEELKKKVDQAMKEEARRLIKMDKDNKGETTDEASGNEAEKESSK